MYSTLIWKMEIREMIFLVFLFFFQDSQLVSSGHNNPSKNLSLKLSVERAGKDEQWVSQKPPGNTIK